LDIPQIAGTFTSWPQFARNPGRRLPHPRGEPEAGEPGAGEPEAGERARRAAGRYAVASLSTVSRIS